MGCLEVMPDELKLRAPIWEAVGGQRARQGEAGGAPSHPRSSSSSSPSSHVRTASLTRPSTASSSSLSSTETNWGVSMAMLVSVAAGLTSFSFPAWLLSMASALSLSVLRTARGLGLARPLWKARTGAHAHTRPPRPRPALQRFYCASTPPNPPSTPTTATKAALDSNIKALGGELRTAKGVELSAAEIARKEKVLADFEQDFLSFAARDKVIVLTK